MKKLSEILLSVSAFAAVMISLCIGASAATSGTTGDLAFSISNGTLTLTRVYESGKTLYSSADYADVTKIPWYGESFTKVAVSEGVTGIGNNNFNGFSDVTQVSLPSTLREIGNYAFMKTGIKSIVLPEKLSDIGYGAFNTCKSLTTVVYNSKNLKTAKGSNTFVIFGSSVKNITLGENVQSLGDYIFCMCGISSISLPDSVGKIGEGAFASCTSLTTVSSTSKSKLYCIDGRAFSGCSALSSITMPKLLTEIGDEAFANCTNVRSLDLSYHVTKIGADAFKNCTNLQINTTTDAYAYDYCKLYDVTCNASGASYGDIGTTPTVEQFKFQDAGISTLNGKLTIFVKFDQPIDKECVHVAFYNENDRVVDYVIIPSFSSNLDHIYLTCSDVSSATYAKVFVWDSLETLRPVSAIKKVEIPRT